MRAWLWIWPGLIASSASADGIRWRQLRELEEEPLLHLDATMPHFEDAAGGITDREGVAVDLWSRVRLSSEGKWWQTGDAPSLFASDLDAHGWRASAELSLDLGWFRVGVNWSESHTDEGTHKMQGLFVYRGFDLSRYMHAWIMIGVARESFDDKGPAPPTQGNTAGITLGTTFR